MLLLDQNNPTQLYVQLYEQIRAQVLSGKLPPHSKLPSVRELSVVLATSRNTVENAYQELLAEGYIYTKPRSGFFVSTIDNEFASAAVSAPRGRQCAPAIKEKSSIRYDFHPARLCPESFPAATWRKLFTESLREDTLQYGQYRDPQGELQLRRGIRNYLERSRGVICHPDQIVICSGLQQSLDIVAHLMSRHLKRVAVEDPGYYLPRTVLRNHAFEIVPIPVGGGGLEVERLGTDCSAVYVTPSHQFPTGHVMPIAKRLKLIAWAQKSGGIILEDDYDSELRYQGKPIPALQGLCPQGNVVYFGSMSKVLSPALRISYLVLPPALLDRYREVFRGYFSTVSLLEQQTLASFMEQGYWDRHLRRMRTTYKRKHDALVGAIDRYFGARAEVTGQGAGLHVVLRLKDPLYSERDLVERAAQKGILLFPFSEFYASGMAESADVLLGFGGMTTEQLERGVELLYQAWYRSA